jgi:hypothetical protein
MRRINILQGFAAMRKRTDAQDVVRYVHSSWLRVCAVLIEEIAVARSAQIWCRAAQTD